MGHLARMQTLPFYLYLVLYRYMCAKFKHLLFPFFQTHLDALYDNLLEQNLSRIIEPFARVQVGVFSCSFQCNVYVPPLGHCTVCYSTSFMLNRVYFLCQIEHVASLIALPLVC